ncbi:MAG: hypothetical protein O0X96_07385, partial [Methanocorpusculum sp.]|nr:hypothetical protein [Methanocorpusculum sp.]
MKPIPAISILLLCILFLAVPAAAADDNFPEVQFAGTGESSYTDLLPADLLTKNINEMFGAKNLREIAEQHAVRFSLGKQSEVIRPVTLDDNETETPAPTDTPATTQTTPTPTGTPTTTQTT